MRRRSRARRWTILACVSALVLASCGEPAAQPNEAGEVEFVLVDNTISPSVVKVKAGQKVRFIVRNEGRHLHEFMVGRDPVPGSDYLVEDVYEPFEVDFFAGLDVSVSGGMAMNFTGMAPMDMGNGMDMGGEGDGDDGGGGMDMGGEGDGDDGGGGTDMGGEEGHHGAMVMLQPGSVSTNEPGEVTVIEFTIPEDRTGVWEIGCFQEAGQHFEDGMRATLIVEG